jgi:hypothetical protein
MNGTQQLNKTQEKILAHLTTEMVDLPWQIGTTREIMQLNKLEDMGLVKTERRRVGHWYGNSRGPGAYIAIKVAKVN